MPETLRVPELVLENGTVLRDAPVAYRTWGRLNDARDNAVLVCHALTGNTNADDWWGPLLGPGKAFDTGRFFVICANIGGSPYGSVSPLSTDPATGRPYRQAFPAMTIRDTVALHKALLDQLGVRQVFAAVGGSMGGMQVLEWAFYGDFVKLLIPIAVGGRHSAWCIGWSEAQRQAIFADPRWREGGYDPAAPPAAGLAAARMIAMISYRSRGSFEARFGRERRQENGAASVFAIESYLSYQGQKLVDRFDANCYVHLTRQMDTHDVARGRGAYPDVLRRIEQPTLVIGIDSDILYPLVEQEELAEYIPEAELAVVSSPHGHDAFLIEFQTLESLISPWMKLFLAKQDPVKEETCL